VTTSCGVFVRLLLTINWKCPNLHTSILGSSIFLNSLKRLFKMVEAVLSLLLEECAKLIENEVQYIFESQKLHF
jgi:hypothetical protein